MTVSGFTSDSEEMDNADNGLETSYEAIHYYVW